MKFIGFALCILMAWFRLVIASPSTVEQTARVISVANGTVTVHVVDADLTGVIKTLGERAAPPFTVTAFHSRKVTADFLDIPIVDALHRLIQKNYTLILDKKTRRPLKVFLLNDGEETRTELFDQGAGDAFQVMLRSDPKKIVRAQVILAASIQLSEIGKLLYGKNISLRSLRHSAGTQQGGYILKEGEAVEEAVKDYERDHQFFLDMMRREIQGTAHSPPNPGLHEAVKQALEELMLTHEHFAANGLRIVHLELQGGVGDIQQFMIDNGIAADIMLIQE